MPYLSYISYGPLRLILLDPAGRERIFLGVGERPFAPTQAMPIGAIGDLNAGDCQKVPAKSPLFPPIFSQTMACLCVCCLRSSLLSLVGEMLALGKEVSALGKEVSALGREVPALGKEVPASGKEVPASGKEVPASGKEVPASGKEVLASVREVLALGREVPALYGPMNGR